MIPTLPVRKMLLLAPLAVGLAVGGMAPSTSARAQQAPAASVQRIAAVVNDRIISLRDVQERMILTMLSSGIQDTPENRKKMVSRALRSLIDDTLKLQEAERLKLTVSDADIQRAKRQIESNNKMAAGGLDETLRRGGISPKVLDAQLRAEVAWIKVTQSSLRRQAVIQPEEIDATLNQLRAVQGKPERLLAEIVLLIDSPDQEEQVRALADKVSEQARSAPDSFPALAGQFSAVATAAKGGSLGWVAEGQMDDEVEQALVNMTAGTVSPPIRTANGYTILFLRDVREKKATPVEQRPVALSQLYLPTRGSSAMPPASRADLEQTLRTSLTSCEDVNKMAQDLRLPSSGDIGTLPLNQLPPPVQEVVRSLPEGQLSPRVAISGAEVMVMVCGRPDTAGLPSREQIEQQLEQEKMDRLSQRALRDLRRSALIDVRL